MSQEKSLSAEPETSGSPQSGLAVIWRIFFYLIVLPGAFALAVKWLFGV